MGMFPDEGVLLPPQPNTQFPNPAAGPGYEWAAARFNQAVAQERAYNANQIRRDNYIDITLGNWYDYNYSTGRLPYDSKAPVPPGELWVGTDYYVGQFVQYTQVERPEYPVCSFTEDKFGWTINGRFYKRQPPPQHTPVLVSTMQGGELVMKPKRKVSAAGRARIAAAQKARWANKQKGGTK